MSCSKKLRCRKVPCILRYHVPNRNKFPEKFAHHILFLFCPFRSEAELLSTEFHTYVDKLSEPGILEIINFNKSIVEPYTDLVDEAFIRFRNDITLNSNSFAQQENDDVVDRLDELLFDNEDEEILNESYAPSGSSEPASNVLNDIEIESKIRSLNTLQKEIFDRIHKWARDFVKSTSCKVPWQVEPFYIFLIGGAGVGKSHLLTY